MHIIKIGDSYVTRFGTLSTFQADAMHVNIPFGDGNTPYSTPRLVKFKTRLDVARRVPIDGSPTPLGQHSSQYDHPYDSYPRNDDGY